MRSDGAVRPANVKKVLIIGPDFPPSSLPPALRIRFFANHLTEFGWRPLVLATDPKYYESTVDPENECLLDGSVEVVRTAALKAKWTRRIGLGDLGLRSLWHHWRAARRICRREAVDLIFIPVPPYFSMVLGRLLHGRFAIPYVVDYIDPWVIDDYWRLPRRLRPPKWALAYIASRLLEPYALRKVSRIVGVSEGTCSSVARLYPWLNSDLSAEIPYGGEPADFDYLRRHPRRNPLFDKKDGFFHLSYTGAFIPGMHATARAIFRAVRDGLESSPSLYSRLRIHFLGTNYSADDAGEATLNALRLSQEEGVGELVTETPRRAPYLDALQLLLDSDGLLAVGSDAPHYTASKLFPYLLAGKPILAVFHEASSVVSILRRTQGGAVVAYGNSAPPERRVHQIRRELERMLQGELPAPKLSRDDFAPYTARAMTGRLARVFDEAVGEQS